jgi:CubicO group peptidase (beta-lactamase class C family)
MKATIISNGPSQRKLLLRHACFFFLIFTGVARSDAQQYITRIDGTKISTDTLNSYLPQLMRKAKVPGLAIAIFNNDHVVYKKTFGYANLEKKEPLKPTTNIYGASLSKTVFTVLVMKLVEQGKLDLDKPGVGLLKSPYGWGAFKEGHGDGFQHYFIVFPKQGTGVLIMTNSDNGESMFKELLELAIADTYTPWKWQRYIPYQDF